MCTIIYIYGGLESRGSAKEVACAMR